ncbi:SUMF1/EgtB/PvdO family nonheme iron enzyme [Zoogloea sp.]|uniref:SUMF1/EgtB/PvdO family nonheme iron enzyme n=1 Tax=Zoogloea sp. TaxID=49181 RepID=UPI0025CF1AA2|nr:SUMF1/EgtB/PvdO family nonheme iron enzyme [Zoogloea sp.]MCK6394560.1 SUMF1/EgtB/PvdO family nonheme iron enzyme [Zoogloea sp.]
MSRAFALIRGMLVLTALYSPALYAQFEDSVQVVPKEVSKPTQKPPPDKSRQGRDSAEAERKAQKAMARLEAAEKELAALKAQQQREREAVDRRTRSEADYPAGRQFRDCPSCPEMVVIPSGSFDMGSPDHGGSDEGPVRRVTHPKRFALGRFEVTFVEYDQCVSEGGCGHRPDEWGWGRENRPVINVNWDDAQAYVKWLSGKTGKPYRLPSEAEWEYAARAGSTARYPWGDEIGSNRANCDGCGSEWERKQTAPVGRFAANRYGLHDTVGNVFEWVEDCWNGSYGGAPADGSAWRKGECGQRMVRGGSWFYGPYMARSANRLRFDTGDRSSFLGFRVARTLF